jgi:site-specific DNA-methyltransferase (adenine-specific)
MMFGASSVAPVPAEWYTSRMTTTACAGAPNPAHHLDPEGKPSSPDYKGSARIWVGDCRELLPKIAAPRSVNLIFADPPFNWSRAYDEWDDDMPRHEYCDIADIQAEPGKARSFTMQWLDACIELLADDGSLWVNIPDDSAAEIVVHLKARKLHMVNWGIWHYRFGQNTKGRFINSKVHALYFARDMERRTWNPEEILEISDRRSIYNDVRTENKKDGMPAGMRVPMDVWYGQYWGRIQGNNFERRPNHDNQLPEVYLERVIRCSSKPGDLVLDPFTGSGTTAVVARALGRDYIGTEYSKQNAASAFERIQSGPVRLGAASGQSTAIFEKRTAGPRRRARIAAAVATQVTIGQ